MVDALEVSPSRVQRKRDARKGDIFKNALNIIRREGAEALTIHRLAASCDYTPGALYRYFPSKDALLAELQDYAQKGILAELRERIASWDDRGRGRVPALFRLLAAAAFYLDLRESLPEHAYLIGLLIGDPRPFVADGESERLAPSAAALLAELESLMAAAEKDRALAPGETRDRTLIFWGALHGATQMGKLAKVEPELKPERYYGLRMARALLAGWGGADKDLESAWRLLSAAGRAA